MTTVDTNLIGKQLYVNRLGDWNKGYRPSSYLLGTIVAYDTSSVLVVDSGLKLTRYDLVDDTRDTYTLEQLYTNE